MIPNPPSLSDLQTYDRRNQEIFLIPLNPPYKNQHGILTTRLQTLFGVFINELKQLRNSLKEPLSHTNWQTYYSQSLDELLGYQINVFKQPLS